MLTTRWWLLPLGLIVLGAGGALAAPEGPAPDETAKQCMLHVTAFGGRDQLRLRVFPPSGDETVLWETQEGSRIVSYVPSPSYRRVAILAGKEDSVILLPVTDGKAGQAQRVAEGRSVCFVVWRDENTLSLLSYNQSEWQEWNYDCEARELKLVNDDTSPQAFYQPYFSASAKVLAAIAATHHIVMPFAPDAAEEALRQGTGWVGGSPGLPFRPMAAVSPDGQLTALATGQHAIWLVYAEEGPRADMGIAFVTHVIPLTGLFSEETVWVQNLRWSADSKHLTFTEVHYHPSYANPSHPGARHDMQAWTVLVRLYNDDDRSVSTIAVGRDAYLFGSAGQSRGVHGDS